MEEQIIQAESESTEMTVTSASSTGEDILQLVTFSIGEEEFAVDILYIREINRMQFLTRVPNAPEFVKGVINLRGKVIPVIDLRRRLGVKAKEITKETRIIVLEIQNKTIGIIVDMVNEVLRINKDVIEKPPAASGTIDADFISALAQLEDRILILLDTDKLISK